MGIVPSCPWAGDAQRRPAHQVAPATSWNMAGKSMAGPADPNRPWQSGFPPGYLVIQRRQADCGAL